MRTDLLRPRNELSRWWLLLMMLVSLLACGPKLASAQLVGGGAGAVAEDAPEIDLKVLQFGVGNMVRSGTWIGVQVQVQELGTRSREIALRLGIRDEDGDTAQYQTTVATTPGAGGRTVVWLYARLTHRVSAGNTFVVSAFEARDGSTALQDAGVSATGRRLGRLAFNLGQGRLVDPFSGMIGIIGRPPAGLDQYAIVPSQQADFPAMTHELVAINAGLTTSTLPDRWMGLSAMETLIWTATGAEGEPTDLIESQARALREWVRRGGHLVIVLPAVSQSWMSPNQPLAEIMPRVSLQREEDADLNPLRAMLSHRDITLPTRGLLQTFTPLSGGATAAGATDAQRILVTPDGRTVVTRRIVGHGAVTMIGIDLTNRGLISVGAVEADAFWNRVLGRRGATPSVEEITRLSKPTNNSATHNFLRRDETDIDETLQGTITRGGRAALGVLMAFLIFAVYWLIAGPLGFMLLKRRGQTHHSWVWFVLVGAGFTAVAWTGAQLLRPNRTSIAHLTILDAVAGQGTHRAQIYAAVSLPGYGERTFGIAGAGQGEPSELISTVSSWEAPPSQMGSPGTTFPDARDYPVASRQPDRVRVPVRSTVKNFRVDWLGGAVLRMPLAVSELTQPGTPPIAQELTWVDPLPGRSPLRGALVHELPGTLRNVTIMAVGRQTPMNPAQTFYGGELQAVARFREIAEWKAGELLVLTEDTEARTPGTPTLWLEGNQYLNNQTPAGVREFMVARSTSRIETDLLRATLLHVLRPPQTDTMDVTPMRVVRRELHGLSLGRWFTQPCVIVTGWLDDVPSPVNMAVDGGEVSSNGRVFVRWVYPLADNPPGIARP
jgi:hypothetical protein